MTPSWLDGDWRAPVTAPFQGNAASRSTTLLELIVNQHQVETAGRYARRDVTGDGIPETFCNVFARDCCRALGVPLPEGMTANQLVNWLSTVGRSRGWEQVELHVARAMVDEGQVVVPGWFNRNGGSGHIAIGKPTHGEAGFHIAQAGRTNFARGLLARGFGDLQPTFFAHP
ncbi:MAG: hypothetical protein Q8K32_10975 [Archangium sp.]|nr:hypothetical protein [Archangium sp.]